jgi:hypothetical protein
VVAATSPITYDSLTQTVAFDQAANNVTNDGRYARLAASNTFTAAQLVSSTLRVTSDFTAQSGVYFMNTAAYLGARLQLEPLNSSTRGIVVRGAASQSANLQEWQNSAGSVITSVSASGAVTAAGDFNTTAGFFRLAGNAILGTESGGTALRMIKATSLPGNLSTGVARIYVRDGSTAGTLKLVVKAAAGAETTILDNIPQT